MHGDFVSPCNEKCVFGGIRYFNIHSYVETSRYVSLTDKQRDCQSQLYFHAKSFTALIVLRVSAIALSGTGLKT
jgi:hypothetical protein